MSPLPRLAAALLVLASLTAAAPAVQAHTCDGGDCGPCAGLEEHHHSDGQFNCHSCPAFGDVACIVASLPVKVIVRILDKVVDGAVHLDLHTN